VHLVQQAALAGLEPVERRREERNFAANAVPIGLLSARIV